MAIPDHVATRTALVANLKNEFDDAVKERTQEVQGGSWDGVPVLTIPSIEEVRKAVFLRPVPPPSEHQGEVITPALVLVHVVCPNCSRVNAIPVYLTPSLTITGAGSELAVKAKSKARFHMCDRPEADEVPEELGMLLGGDQDEGSEDESEAPAAEREGCPAPGCSLLAEHPGDHVPVAGSEPPADEPDAKPKRGSKPKPADPADEL